MALNKAIFIGEKSYNFDQADVTSVKPENFDLSSVSDAGFVLIEHTTKRQDIEKIRAIREATDHNVYLKPIIILASAKESVTTSVNESADAVFSYKDFEALYHTEVVKMIEAINNKIDKLTYKEEFGDSNIAFKVLRFGFTREMPLDPHRTVESVKGYVYPAIDMFTDRQDDSILHALAFLEGEDLIEGEFVDRIYLCGYCRSAFLNFREVCSHCGSADLEIQDLIHHFRCAYVGPVKDFITDGKMVCPKCDHSLKHIGVDYDKPSNVYVCNSCGHTSQEAETSSICYNCSTVAPTENLDVHIVKKYRLTGLGMNSAVYGINQLFRQILEAELEIVPISVFKRFLAVEVERIKRYKVSSSSVLLLKIENLNDIYVDHAAKAKEIFSEFSNILKTVLRTSDVITSVNDSSYLILLVETPTDGVETTIKRINENVKDLIETNFGVSPTVKLTHVPVSGDADADSIVKQLLV